MRQILFEIPLNFLQPGWGVPIFGFGLMLCLTIFACPWLAARIAVREGKPREWIDEFALWIFGFGIIGARIFYMVQYRRDFANPLAQFFQIWTGGLVVYGGAMGALIGLLWFCKRRGIRPFWMLDIIAPSLGLGLCIGRLGCLLNGCCYGDYCTDRFGLTFPSEGKQPSPPFVRMIERGHQTPLGLVAFADDRRILAVEPGTGAARSGLAVGDEIVAINGQPTPDRASFAESWQSLLWDATGSFHLSSRPIELKVQRDGKQFVASFRPPRTLPLQPTQLFSSIDGMVICLFALAMLPFRKRDGEVIAWCACIYAITRFCIEYLRYDELPFGNGLTISQNVSIGTLFAGLATLAWVYSRRPNRLGSAELPTSMPASV